jgi:hypothetical protein
MSENKKKSWKKLKNIVEFFWPYYDPLTEKQIIDRKNREEEFSRKNVETKLEDVKDKIKIDFMLEQAEKLFMDEDKRVESVERKCAIIIGFSGVAIMLSFGFIETLFGEPSMSNINIALLFLMFLIVNIHLITALIHSVGGLRKRNYERFNEEDFLNLAEAADPKKQLAALYIECRVKNFRAINLKVDSMHLATQFFKRALIAAFVVAVTIFVFNIYSTSLKKPGPAPKASKASPVIKANPPSASTSYKEPEKK